MRASGVNAAIMRVLLYVFLKATSLVYISSAFYRNIKVIPQNLFMRFIIFFRLHKKKNYISCSVF